MRVQPSFDNDESNDEHSEETIRSFADRLCDLLGDDIFDNDNDISVQSDDDRAVHSRKSIFGTTPFSSKRR